MITTNVDALVRQLEDLHKETTRKLERMVEEFAEAFAEEAIFNTPVGDKETYANLYQIRARIYGWSEDPGLARGNWNFDSGAYTSFSFDRNANDPTGSLSMSRVNSQVSEYKLGQTIWLVNPTPYVYKDGVMGGQSLESGYSKQAPNGITAPTIDYIVNVYQYNFKTVFDRV